MIFCYLQSECFFTKFLPIQLNTESKIKPLTNVYNHSENTGLDIGGGAATGERD